MALVRWNPFGELEDIQRRVTRLLDEGFRGYRGEHEEGLTTGWAPRVDIYEDEKGIRLSAELPGLDQKEIQVGIENNVLTISGERKFHEEEQKDRYTRVERFYGHFTRSFALPPTVDVNGIQARMDRGVLHVELPKREEARPRQIEVKVR